MLNVVLITMNEGINMINFTDFYNKMGPHYDRWMETGESTLEDELNLVLETFPNPCRILDVGCGTGRISIPLQERGYFVVGADISEEMIKVAKEKDLREAYTGNFLDFEYQQEFFNGIISLHAGFSYTNDDNSIRLMIRKCHGLLVRDGRVLWDSPNEDFYGRERVLKWPAGDEIVETICYGHSISNLKELFNKEGFEVGKTWGSYSPLRLYEAGLPRLIIDAQKMNKC